MKDHYRLISELMAYAPEYRNVTPGGRSIQPKHLNEYLNDTTPDKGGIDESKFTNMLQVRSDFITRGYIQISEKADGTYDAGEKTKQFLYGKLYNRCKGEFEKLKNNYVWHNDINAKTDPQFHIGADPDYTFLVEDLFNHPDIKLLEPIEVLNAVLLYTTAAADIKETRRSRQEEDIQQILSNGKLTEDDRSTLSNLTDSLYYKTYKLPLFATEDLETLENLKLKYRKRQLGADAITTSSKSKETIAKLKEQAERQINEQAFQTDYGSELVKLNDLLTFLKNIATTFFNQDGKDIENFLNEINRMQGTEAEFNRDRLDYINAAALEWLNSLSISNELKKEISTKIEAGNARKYLNDVTAQLQAQQAQQQPQPQAQPQQQAQAQPQAPLESIDIQLPNGKSLQFTNYNSENLQTMVDRAMMNDDNSVQQFKRLIKTLLNPKAA